MTRRGAIVVGALIAAAIWTGWGTIVVLATIAHS